MKPYLTFSSEDFACDEEFFRWVKYPERYPHLETFWKDWLAENPSKMEVIEEARHMILSVTQEKQNLPDPETERIVWERIQRSTGIPAQKQVTFRTSWYSRAAVVVLTVGIGWFASFYFDDAETVVVPETTGPRYVKQINNSEVSKTIILSDGTSIILQPQSELEYPATFQPDVREVFLTGQAFFEVARDINKPFLVRSGDIITRVLGTSFTVRNVKDEMNVLVQVKTGKVSVYKEKEKDSSADNDNQVEGVVLTPNQQVLYERVEMKMTKSLVENPTVLIPIAKQEFEFVDAPIKDVFVAIEDAYGVDIVFDEEALSSCYLNASLTDVPLYDKIKLICKGINTTYEIIDSHILVYGKGCNDNVPNPKPF